MDAAIAGGSPRFPTRAGIALGVLIALAVALWLVAGGGWSQARAEAADPEIAATLGVFRGERTAQDDMSGNPLETLRQTGDAQPGEDPSQARRIEVAGANRPAFLWPMTDGVCYSGPKGGGGCVPIATLRQSGVEVAVSSAIRRDDLTYMYARVFGIVRDGVEAVTLSFADGSERAVDVRDNVFFADLAEVPEKVSWQDSRGNHVKPISGGFDPDSLEQFRLP